MRAKSKILSVFMSLVLAVGLCPASAFANGTALTTVSTTLTTQATMSQSDYNAKSGAFVNDARWRDGVYFGNDQGPKLSTYGSGGCFAYACDFTMYMYGVNSITYGASFSNRNDIRQGDVIQVDGGGHTIVVLGRNGDSLYTAEGNYGYTEHRVRVANGAYTVSGLNFHTGWHYVDIATGSSFQSYVDDVHGVAGGIYLKGWTFNKNNLTRSTQVHVYLDGPLGSSNTSWAVEANVARTDVDAAFHVGAYHGFETTISGISPGAHTVYLYANDQYLNQHDFIGSYAVTVSGSAPTCTDFHVGELREGAFTVMAKVTAPSGVKEVKYAIWTEKNGQDDLRWYQGNCTDGNNIWWARVDFGNHNWERGKYIIHLYAYSKTGELTNPGITYEFKETGPTISDVKVSDVSAKGYTVTCKVTDSLGVLRVQFPTWTVSNGQDDLVGDWSTSARVKGTVSGSSATFRVNASDHNGETGQYRTHIYAYDILGNQSCVTVPDVNVHTHSFKESTVPATFTADGKNLSPARFAARWATPLRLKRSAT